jgi:uncharacterized membrane protein
MRNEFWRRLARFDWKFAAAVAVVALVFCFVAFRLRV